MNNENTYDYFYSNLEWVWNSKFTKISIKTRIDSRAYEPCNSPLLYLETVPEKMILAKKDANNQKSAILFQLAYDSDNVTYSWASQFN